MPERNVRQAFEAALTKKHLTRERPKHEVPDVLKELMSPESIGIIEHFGLEAPRLLNNYCCAIEDALIEQVTRANDYAEKCMALSDEVARLKEQTSVDDSLPS